MLVHGCEQQDTVCVCVCVCVCFKKSVLNPYIQMFPSWEAGALGGGWGGAALKGREDQRRQEVRLQWEGAGHRQFPEETQAVKGVKRPP